MEKKIYNRTFWVDHETPVNAENLNKIEKGIQELSELSLRPSDLISSEESPITIEIDCGKVSFDLNSTIIRGDQSIKKVKVVKELQNIDESDGELCIYVNDLEENKSYQSYKLFYGGIEYKSFPDEIKSSIIVCENGELIEEFIQNKINEGVKSISNKFEDLESDSDWKLKDLETRLQSKIDSLQKKVNTLSIKIDMLNDKIKEMEEKR